MNGSPNISSHTQRHLLWVEKSKAYTEEKTTNQKGLGQIG